MSRGLIVAGQLAAAAALLGAGYFAHSAPATRAAAPVTVQCAAGTSPACASWQDMNSSKVVQDLELTDHTGAPIWWCLNAGGCWVGNDRLGVTGSSVYNEAAYLAVRNGRFGELVLGRQVLTSRSIRFLICLQGHSLAECRAAA